MYDNDDGDQFIKSFISPQFFHHPRNKWLELILISRTSCRRPCLRP
jgi:hypothetical protein